MAMDMPTRTFDLSDPQSDVEIRTNPPPVLYSRRLLGYLHEIKDEPFINYHGLRDLKRTIIEQLERGVDRTADILLKIQVLFPWMQPLDNSVTFSPFFLTMLKETLTEVLTNYTRARARRIARVGRAELFRKLIKKLLRFIERWIQHNQEDPETGYLADNSSSDTEDDDEDL